MSGGAFIGEIEAYALLTRAGLRPPKHAPADGPLPFGAGEPVVVKGLGENLWHKSELGAVRFIAFDATAVATECAAMRERVEAAGHAWLGGLVCERLALALARAEGLPTEALVSFVRHEGGWIVVGGCGGLQADALGQLAPPLHWPVALMSPTEAMAEFAQHLLGRGWLGTLRGTRPLTTRARLQAWFEALWRVPAELDRVGATCLELNPVALDEAGEPRPLDAVGTAAARAPTRLGPPEGFWAAVTRPTSVAIAGVSAEAGGAGHTILDNVRRCAALTGKILVVKPGVAELEGVPCVPGVAALRARPVDLLIVALPAAAALALVEELIALGGGATAVALVAGGLGDGADHDQLGAKLTVQLHEARAAGRWTPAVLGPNFLGHWVPALALDTSFIPAGKVAAGARAGGLALVSQSGAFLLSRRSRRPELRCRLALALGNQLDVALPDVLAGLADDAACTAVAAYVEGFGAGQLAACVAPLQRLRARGVPVVLYRAARTAAGQASAATHTGALAGDLALEGAVLERLGVRFAETITAFEAAAAWLSVGPHRLGGAVAVVTNAGFEAVNASDRAGGARTQAVLTDAETAALGRLLVEQKLAGLVTPRLPLDLTPMAREDAFVGASEILLGAKVGAVVVGLVPFTRNLDTTPEGAARLAGRLARAAAQAGKPLGVAVDAGDAYAAYRAAFADAGLPGFARMEEALAGLAVLA